MKKAIISKTFSSNDHNWENMVETTIKNDVIVDI